MRKRGVFYNSCEGHRASKSTRTSKPKRNQRKGTKVTWGTFIGTFGVTPRKFDTRSHPKLRDEVAVSPTGLEIACEVYLVHLLTIEGSRAPRGCWS